MYQMYKFQTNNGNVKKSYVCIALSTIIQKTNRLTVV